MSRRSASPVRKAGTCGLALVVLCALMWSVTGPAPAGALTRPRRGLTTLAGSGAVGQVDGSAFSASFGDILDVALNRTGSYLYVLEYGVGGGSNSIRKVSTRTGAVTTVASGGYLDGSPTHIEVDSNGNPWVAVTTGTNQKGLVRFSESEPPTVMVSNICCGYYGASQVGDAFEFDHANGMVYYSTATGVDPGPDEPKFPRIYRLPLSGLPAAASSGEDLGGTGNFIRGPVTDMEFGPDGKLYIMWPKTGPWSAYATQLWRLNGPGSFTEIHGNWPGHEERMAFSPRSTRLFSTCWFWCSSINMRMAYGAGAPEETLVGGASGYVDGDPGQLNVPRGVAISVDGSTGYLGDLNNHRIRRFRVPNQFGPGSDDATRGSHGDPVDTATGSFRHAEVDLAAPAGAGPVDIARSYSSVGPTGGVFGPRWSSDLDVALLVSPDEVVLQTPNGRQVGWEDVSSVWTPVDGQLEILTEETAGWTVTDRTGREREFDEDGRLVAVRAPGQPEVTITWGDLSPTTLTSGSGYEVDFEDWSFRLEADPITSVLELVQVPVPDGTIDRATTSDGREVDYGYDRSTAVATLASVSRPHAAGQPTGTYGVRTYEVERDTLLTRIVDEVDGTRTRVVVENTYDADGRVTEQVTANADETTFAYDTALDGMGNPVSAPGFTTVTDTASGDATVYEHSAAGELLGMTDTTGNAATHGWTASGQRSSLVSRSGITTDVVYDAAGRVEERTETAGATTRTVASYTYVTPDSSPAALSDDRVATSTDAAGVTTTYTYTGSRRAPDTVSIPCDPASTDAATPCPGSGLSTTTYTYHSGPLDGLAETVTDADGVVTEYTYDSDRAVATVTTYDGATPLVTTFDTVRLGDPGWSETNPAAVMVRSGESPGGAVTEKVFDAEGRVLEERDALYDGTTHLATVYEYTLDGELASVTDPGGLVTTYHVARVGDPGWAEAPEVAEVSTVTGADGVSTITKTDRSGDVVVEQRGDPAVPAELATTTNVYGPLGRLESTTDPTGVTLLYTHDVEGRVTAVTDEGGNATETAYDAFGRPEVVTDPLDNTTTTTYDAAGRVVEVEDREGHSTTYDHDAAGRQHVVTDARGGVTTTRFTPAGRVASLTDATGRTTSFRYDTAGRRVEVEAPSGATTTTAYDLDGRVDTITSAEGRITDYGYDDLSRILTVDDPTKGTTTMTYTASGQLATLADAGGGTVTYGYTDGLLTSVTDPLSEVTTYGYDSRGNRVLRVDALAGEREWEYDLADRLVKEIDPLNRETVMAYDDLGRLETRTDGAGRVETRGYDAAGRLVSSAFGADTATFAYDGEGRRTTITGSQGTATLTYDEVGNVTAVDDPGPRDVSWTWDLAGRRVEMSSTSYRQRNVYDADGRLDEVEQRVGSAWVDSVDLALDDDGLVTGRDVVGGMATRWDRDLATGRVETYREDLGGTVTTTDLTYEATGRVATETTGAGVTTYDYDDAGQLISADRPGTTGDEVFVYDELGRRSTSSLGSTTTTWAWDAASQLTSRTVGSTVHTFTYDASGRRTRESWNGGSSYRQWGWTVRGELGSIKHTTASGVDETRRYLRGDGQLLGTSFVSASGNRATQYTWDITQGLPEPVSLRSNTNVVTATRAAGLARIQCTSTTEDCDGPVAQDVLGSALATPDTDDAVSPTAYTAFGEDGSTSLVHTIGYRGELQYGGLVHLRAREYDPDTGLFLSPDPLIGVDGTTTVANPYHYTDNDPVNSVDPSGLRPNDCSVDAKCSVVVDDTDDARTGRGSNCIEERYFSYNSCNFEEEAVWAAETAGIDPVLVFGLIVNETQDTNAQGDYIKPGPGHGGPPERPDLPGLSRLGTSWGPTNLDGYTLDPTFERHRELITEVWADLAGEYRSPASGDVAIESNQMNVLLAALRLKDLRAGVQRIADRSGKTVTIIGPRDFNGPHDMSGSDENSPTLRFFAMSAVLHQGYFSGKIGQDKMQTMLWNHEWDANIKARPDPVLIRSDMSRAMCDAAISLHASSNGSC